MREIKFRAFVKEKEKVLPVYSMYFSWLESQPISVADCGDLNCGMCIDYYEKEEVEIMQYTGLNDKNGKEIFEGDILKSESSYNRVFWNEDCWSFEVMKRHSKNGGWIVGHISSGLNIAAKYSEVIGNIYENPELTKD